MKHFYFCKTLKDQIKCQEMLFAKGAHWVAGGQAIKCTDKHFPVVYHFREYDKSLIYSKHINFKEAKEAYPRCIYFRTNNLMETE